MALLFCQHFLLSNITIERDCSLAVGWVNSTANRPWALSNELNQIDFLLSQVNCISVQHIYREANDLADKLAKEGVSRESPLWVCYICFKSQFYAGYQCCVELRKFWLLYQFLTGSNKLVYISIMVLFSKLFKLYWFCFIPLSNGRR